MTAKSNVRVGFNIFDYNHSFTKDGINYNGDLKLRSVQVTYDQFFGPFHISPGALIYNGSKGDATASVRAGQSFSLGSTTFYSSSSSPVNGSGTLMVNKAAPMILFGFGNLLPRSQRHFGVNFEAGVVFEGSKGQTESGRQRLPDLSAGGLRQCRHRHHCPVEPAVEQNKLNNDVGPFQYYPVISLGFSYKF